MAKTKLTSIRLNQIIDSNKIDNETFALIYMQKKLNRIKLAKKYFGNCNNLNQNANYYVKNPAFLDDIKRRIGLVEWLIKTDDLKGIKILKEKMIMAIPKT